MDNSGISYNEEEWKILYDKMQPVIAATLRRNIGVAIAKAGLDVEEELKDLAQTVWLTLWVGYLNGSLSVLTPAAAVEACRFEVKKALKRQFNFDSTIELVPIDSVSESANDTNVLEQVHIQQGLERVFAQLSIEEKALFDARVYYGTPYAELSQELQEPVHVLKMRMVRIKRKVKKELGYDVEI